MGESELTGHSIEWVRDVIARWIGQNETAQQLQRIMPHYVYEHVCAMNRGHDALPMAMALSMHPDSVIEARAWLESAHAQVTELASMSHPAVTLDVTTDDETTRAEVADERQLQAQLAEIERIVERNGRGLDEILRRLDARDAAESRRSARPVA